MDGLSIGQRLAALWQREDGAVTADWVVMAAAVVGIGFGATEAVRLGVIDLGSGVTATLSSSRTADLSLMGYRFRALTHDGGANVPYWNSVEGRIAQGAEFSDAQLLHHFSHFGHMYFEQALSNGYDDVCHGCRGAGNRLDIMRLNLAEMERRGLATDEHRGIVADAERRYDARFP